MRGTDHRNYSSVGWLRPFLLPRSTPDCAIFIGLSSEGLLNRAMDGSTGSKPVNRQLPSWEATFVRRASLPVNRPGRRRTVSLEAFCTRTGWFEAVNQTRPDKRFPSGERESSRIRSTGRGQRQTSCLSADPLPSTVFFFAARVSLRRFLQGSEQGRAGLMVDNWGEPF